MPQLPTFGRSVVPLLIIAALTRPAVITGDCDSSGGTWQRWRAICSNSTCSDVTWGQGSSENVVWGSTCSGADCATPWRIGVTGYVLSPGTEDTAVVWGTDGDGAVSGTSCTDASCEPVIWDD